ncbi:hypothetical protein [Flagellimonas flava]|uniref:Uncharacterized protein n=1 Tax=Flagellimonas flava TaxID=570519 RepID=A0A1M5ITV6_9FLAO|nr:hypothetical protein [Allomuricauda flava]SHG31778.1 hypothetical protein SAMN04488116_0926 [Allomuricauda flava]
MYSPKSLRIPALFLIFSFFIVSCSKDYSEMEDLSNAPDDSEIPEQDAPGDDDANDGTSNEETLELEQGFTLDEGKRFAHLELSDTAYNQFLTGNGDMRGVSNKVYEHFTDDFDFIIILSVESSQPENLYYGLTTPAKNDIEGLGRSLWDNTDAFGSNGKLKTVIHMPRTEYIRNGPFLHEILHYWSNHGLIPTTAGGHWGYSSVGGQLGGFDELESLGDDRYRGLVEGSAGFGTVANGGNSVPYANLELYSMGLIGEDELETVTVAENPQPTSEFGVFTADAINSYTAEDIVAENGVRVPSYQNAQTEFDALVVVISKNGVSDEQLETLNFNLENFARNADPDASWGSTYNFWKATFGKATINFEVASEQLK